jgi:hypothetical protein
MTMMRKRLNNAFLVLLMIAGANTLNGQLRIDGEFRTRINVDHGYKVPVKSEADIVSSADQRSRIILNYDSEKYSTRFTIQDARVWGNDDMYNPTGIEGNSYALGVYEAWVNLKIRNNQSLRIGRQVWNYDDMRILSHRNWWTSGLSYDGLLYRIQMPDKGWSLDLGFSYNNDGTKTGAVNNSTWTGEKVKTMNFVHINKTFNSKFSGSLIFTLSGKEDITNGNIMGTGTHGLNFGYNTGKGSADGWYGTFSSYYQHGTDVKKGTDGQYKDISAYLLTAETGLRTLSGKLTVGAGMELISGHDYSDTDEDYINTRHSFDLQYSGRFPFYGGNMNHFLIQDSYKTGTKGGGYFDPYLTLTYKASPKTIWNADVYFPSLTSDVLAHTHIDSESGKPAGTEVDENGEPVYWSGSLGTYIDLGMTHKFSKEVIFKTGLSMGMVSDIKNQMVYGYQDIANKKLHDMGTNYYGWMMLVVKPGFLN